MERVARLGCLVCGSPAELHHVTAYADRMGRLPRSHQRIAPLCPMHHRVGSMGGFNFSVEAMGHRGFFEEYGCDLMAEAERLWAESEDIEARRAA